MYLCLVTLKEQGQCFLVGCVWGVHGNGSVIKKEKGRVNVGGLEEVGFA